MEISVIIIGALLIYGTVSAIKDKRKYDKWKKEDETTDLEWISLSIKLERNPNIVIDNNKNIYLTIGDKVHKYMLLEDKLYLQQNEQNNYICEIEGVEEYFATCRDGDYSIIIQVQNHLLATQYVKKKMFDVSWLTSVYQDFRKRDIYSHNEYYKGILYKDYYMMLVSRNTVAILKRYGNRNPYIQSDCRYEYITTSSIDNAVNTVLTLK
jgi:hypothetical protein